MGEVNVEVAVDDIGELVGEAGVEVVGLDEVGGGDGGRLEGKAGGSGSKQK